MISHKYKCIFVEVPKTGSSSIRSIVGYPPKPHLNIAQIRDNMLFTYTHYEGIVDHFLGCLYPLLPKWRRRRRGEAQFNQYFKFGFVRNPWDRVVSLYFRSEGLQLKDEMSFEQFVEWIKYSSSTCIRALPHTNQLDYGSPWILHT